ncbi:hypothetical protein IC582_023147 [Cucumis melo]|uniref:Serine/threonine-protein kinase TAO3 n=2 Tax=Cucumis melo TaxID=3656 RepID=A0A5D3CUK3_CUCMM|nr:uncharacterized protein LOC103489035 [Cucumis melo]TYK15581.1 Serine/threonine-protein kinase TAO3 [Cucumis melo var. makuwa]
MGNCQAVDAAALVIQHPSGRIERLYWPVVASEVMRTNPGHYVSLIIPLPQSEDDNSEPKTVRFTRVKLLRPNDTLALGHAYRLVTTQEVMKVLRAKKYAKSKKPLPESEEKPQTEMEKRSAGDEEEDTEKNQQVVKHERHRIRTPVANTTAARSRAWRPSLQSISEAAS